MDMFTLRRYLLNSIVCYSPSDTATTTDTSTNTDTNADDKDKDKNNQDDILDFNKSIWEDDTDTSDDDDNKKKDDLPDPDANKRASEHVKQHIKGLNLTGGIDFPSMLGENGELSVEKLQAGFDQLAQNIYVSAMRDANKVSTNKINAAVDKAVEKSTTEINTTTAYRRMEEKLPSTKNPNIAPIAQQALDRFRKKGATIEEGIEKVRKFLQSTANEVNNNRADDDPPSRRPGSGQFEGNPADAPPPVEDWEEYLEV